MRFDDRREGASRHVREVDSWYGIRQLDITATILLFSTALIWRLSAVPFHNSRCHTLAQAEASHNVA